MMRLSVRLLPAVCLVLLATLALARRAEAAAGKEAEFWLGDYVPGPANIDSAVSFGARTLMSTSKRSAFGVEVAYVDTSGEARSGGTTGHLDWSSLFVDLIGDISLSSGKKIVPVFSFGAGVAFEKSNTNVSGTLVGVSIDDLDRASFTLQAGLGVKITLGKSMFLRPAARVRWFETRSQDDIDAEYLVGLGWRY